MDVENVLRMLQIPPLHPDGQEQVFGPTHFPLFMHMGSHTPKHRAYSPNI